MSLNRPGAWAGRQPPQNQGINPNIFAANQLNFTAQQMALAPSINALVNPAAFGNINSAALANAQRQLIPPRQASPTGGGQRGPNQRTFVGQITKLVDNYGFIDEDVFFQTSVIRGQMPRVGDRVMVEATFNPSMPFKWNAFRIQPINEMNQPVQHQSQVRQPDNQQQSNRWGDRTDRGRDDRGPRGSSYERNRSQRRQSPPRREDRRSPPRRASPPRRVSPVRRQSPARREPSKRERERSPIRESRESRRSPPAPPSRRDDSPPRRRQRIIPRYQCYFPRALASDSMNYIDLKKRYGSLYIPSDFVRCDLSWKTSFNLENPIDFCSNAVSFHVIHKDIDYPFAETSPLPSELPDDADSRYVVKVLLLTHPGAIEIRKKVTGLLADGSLDEALDVQSLFKVLHFVTGSRGKGEVMGIGGPWSPSLDGQNPLDPQTLIKTAVRTTRAMTGVDLSNCPTWYKMLHLRYCRVEREGRVDNVVLLLPDTAAIPNFLPTPDDYQKLVQEILPEQLKFKISQIDAEQFVPQSDAAKKVQAANDKTPTTELNTDETFVKAEPNKEEQVENVAAGSTAESLNQSTEANNIETNGTASATSNKTHWSQLQVKSLKVAELREQLELRGLDSKGVKNILAQRLQEAVDAEKANEEAGSQEAVSKSVDNDVSMADEDEAKPADINPEELVMTDEVNEKMDTSEVQAGSKPEEEKTAAETEQPKAEPPPYTKEEKDEYKKELDRFEKSKKDRKSALERHFSFPKEPCVFIYPNKTAKAGKFDCRSASIQSILDYRLDDNKESSFEVFLFAEAYHEAIDRGFAFSIYHILNSILDKDAERKRREEALTKVEETSMETEEIKSEEEKVVENGIESNGVELNTEENPPQSEEKSSEEKSTEEKSTEEKDEKAESKKEKSKEDPRTNFKALVSDVDTFTAFCHFDQNICGYLSDRDLEEILHSLGLNISRAAAQRLIKRVSSRDRFNYRNITDKWVDKDFNVKYAPEFIEDAPTRAQLLKAIEEKPDIAKTLVSSTAGSTPDVTQTGVVFYKGKVLNIAHAQEQHNLVASEKASALLKIQELESILKTTKDQRDSIEKKFNDTLETVAQNKKKLQEAVEILASSTKKIQGATDIVSGQLDETSSAI